MVTDYLSLSCHIALQMLKPRAATSCNGEGAAGPAARRRPKPRPRPSQVSLQ